MNGRLYTICRNHPETTQEGEKVVCLDAATGELIWETANNVFLSDSPAERVGWSSVVADPASGNVFALGLGCFFQCLDGQTGKPLWQRSLSEEYGMLSTYGGRTNFPVVFEDLVIISGVMTGWGENAVPAHRFVAFNKTTGVAQWLMSTRLRPEDTTYSTPVLANFNGQAAMVTGAGDGSIYAFQPRTGTQIWSYDASTRGVNTTPLVVGNRVYAAHSEQNATDTTVLGAVFCLDGNARGKIGEGDLLWKVNARTVGRCQPLLFEGRLYVVEDGATLWIMDPETGKDIGKQKLGRIMMGSMVAGDGKIYVGETTGRWSVLEPTENGVKVIHQLRLNNEEILGSPVIAQGRIYLPTLGAMYCIGNKDVQPSSDPIPPLPPEAPVSAHPQVSQLQLSPVESILFPGESLQLTVRGFNEFGQRIDAKLPTEWSVEGPATIRDGELTAAGGASHAPILISVKSGELTAKARARVIPPLPWRFDFAKGVPPTWIGIAYRHQPREVDGDPALVKVTTIPKGTRSQGWMGRTDLHDYTIQADLKATRKNEQLPDMGLINQRYTLDLMGAQELQLRSWTSRLQLRFAKTVPFAWEPDQWYTMKFRSENVDGKAVLKGKVWLRGTTEPKDWTIEAADATPNVTGSPGLFGQSSVAEFYIDNVQVTPNES